MREEIDLAAREINSLEPKCGPEEITPLKEPKLDTAMDRVTYFMDVLWAKCVAEGAEVKMDLDVSLVHDLEEVLRKARGN